ncbi:unnamed protein product [Didymodactylos carnosus]|uniref:Phospholipid scramblase n=1 Tax=Didymodactylos carnosus TaxID=1234261 RepID=A0A8S2J9M2_9BILA|nr:unnamed protein product [Didymodactylos carnosus]CAF3794186.1 unnamed protein product [Didymodactylos carnosus]
MQQYQSPPPYNYQFTPNDQQTPLKQVPIQQQPIFQQPGNPTPPHQSTSAVQWVTQPQHVQPGIPPGLSYLVDVDYLALKQNPSITQSKYYITKRCSFLRGHYTLKDAVGEAVLKAIGPFCICQGVCCCCCENKFTACKKKTATGYELLRNFEFGLRTTDLVDCCINRKYSSSEMCCPEVNLAIQLKNPIIPLLFEDIEWPPIGLSTAMAE